MSRRYLLPCLLRSNWTLIFIFMGGLFSFAGLLFVCCKQPTKLFFTFSFLTNLILIMCLPKKDLTWSAIFISILQLIPKRQQITTRHLNHLIHCSALFLYFKPPKKFITGFFLFIKPHIKSFFHPLDALTFLFAQLLLLALSRAIKCTFFKL